MLRQALDKHLPVKAAEQHKVKISLKQKMRNGRQIHSADPGALMYLPIGGSGNIRCPTAADAAAVNIAQMAFLATSMNILSIVANINNNINNNVVSNTNVNNGNQVNVMVPILMP